MLRLIRYVTMCMDWTGRVFIRKYIYVVHTLVENIQPQQTLIEILYL